MMGKKKATAFDKEQLDMEDRETVARLKQGLIKIDNFPIETPDQQWFEKLVLTEQQNIKRKFVRDLSIFLILAIFILSGIMISLFERPELFAILQIAVTFFLIVYTCGQFARKVKIHGE
jgi:hypothetical protein